MAIVCYPPKHLHEHVKEFKGQGKALKKLWGRLQPHNMVGQSTESQEKSEAEFMVALFIGSVEDDPRYKPSVDRLHRDFYNGNNNYPDSIEGVVALLKHDEELKRRGIKPGMSFAQEEIVDDDVDQTRIFYSVWVFYNIF